jgi:hypothetical protein
VVALRLRAALPAPCGAAAHRIRAPIAPAAAGALCPVGRRRPLPLLAVVLVPRRLSQVLHLSTRRTSPFPSNLIRFFYISFFIKNKNKNGTSSTKRSEGHLLLNMLLFFIFKK